jgi:hypothetical protein
MEIMKALPNIYKIVPFRVQTLADIFMLTQFIQNEMLFSTNYEFLFLKRNTKPKSGRNSVRGMKFVFKRFHFYKMAV